MRRKRLAILGRGITSGMRLTNAGNVDYLKFMYPGVIGMSILFTSIFSAISIIWDREFGFLKEVLVAPVPRWGVALGKAMGGATVALVQTMIMVLMAPLVGISLSILLVLKLLFIAFLMSIAVTSLGITIAARMTSMQSFQMIMNFIVMPLYFLSGAMFPMTTSPVWLKSVMAIDPLSISVHPDDLEDVSREMFAAALSCIWEPRRNCFPASWKPISGHMAALMWKRRFRALAGRRKRAAWSRCWPARKAR